MLKPSHEKLMIVVFDILEVVVVLNRTIYEPWLKRYGSVLYYKSESPCADLDVLLM